MHNPLRSEREVFRAVLIVAIAAGAVVILTVLTRPAIGAAGRRLVTRRSYQ